MSDENPLFRATMKGQRSPDGPTRTASESLGFVLVVDDEPRVRKLVSVTLENAGYDVTLATTAEEALERIAEMVPDVVVSDVMMPGIGGLGLLSTLRQDRRTELVPVILLTARGAKEDIVEGLGLGADDYLSKPFDTRELVARVQAKIRRPSVPAALIPRDRRTGLLTESAFTSALQREARQAAADGPFLVHLAFEELPMVRSRLGNRAFLQVVAHISSLINREDIVEAGTTKGGHFLLLLGRRTEGAVEAQLAQLSRVLVNGVFTVGEDRLHLTPIVGYTTLASTKSPTQMRNEAETAWSVAASHLDLRPIRFQPGMSGIRLSARRQSWVVSAGNRLRLPFQIFATLVIGVAIPFVAYALLDRYLVDVSVVVYLLVVLSLLLTAYFIWAEGFHAIAVAEPPETPGRPFPKASAIIAAFLPNEAATIVDTIESFLRIDYPQGLQIILAYNTPRPLPIEDVLRHIATRDERLHLLRVEGSTSKAQNVNAAIAHVTGEFVGVFDADHHPNEDSFHRAWRTLSNGYHVVQGHCVIRNGADSWVARTVAVEFEAIYAVSHPGRSSLHHFGVFGGSNGYWLTPVLRQIRMRGSMLTEDIDSSLRCIEDGFHIASDRGLLSRELAPVTLTALWNQRMRWAQGWFQVSLRHLIPGVLSPNMSVRQKLGYLHLLAWREIYPWVSIQIFPIVLFWMWRDGIGSINWIVPFWIATAIFTFSVAPGQTLFVAKLGVPEIKRHKWWLISYLVISIICYTEFKNVIGRVSQLKECLGERQWKVTPRTTTKTGA